MELSYMKSLPLGGFNFDNCIRNKALEQSKPGNQVKTMKTGTTICGVVFKVSANTSIITCLYRMELYWLLILELLVVTSLEIRTVKRFITWLQTFTAQVLELLLIAITLLVSIVNI